MHCSNDAGNVALTRHDADSPHIDLSRPRDRRILAIFAVVSVGFFFVTAVGSYETYHYTESAQFCGQTCHIPMEPEAVTSQQTAHARVECASCHVGPGVAAYFKTKVNGVKQLYHTVLNDYHRPIPCLRLIRVLPRRFASNAIGLTNMSETLSTPTSIISLTKRTHRLGFVFC